jgi:DNA primase
MATSTIGAILKDLQGWIDNSNSKLETRNSKLIFMLSPTTIDTIRDLAIEQIIEKYTTLKKSGVNYKGCCPFPDHNESTPSFHVNVNKNTFKCFGCGRGGDGIEFVMIKENLPFIEACKSIAQQHGKKPKAKAKPWSNGKTKK